MAYEFRMSVWSSDVCSSDLEHRRRISAEKGPAQSATAASRGGKYAAGQRAPGGPANGAGQTCIGHGALEVPVDPVLEVTGQGDFRDLRLDVHLPRHHVQRSEARCVG